MKLFYSVLIICVLISGCSLNKKSNGFDPKIIKSFSSTTPINIIVPENNESILVRNLYVMKNKNHSFYYDLNSSYLILKNQIKEVLKINNVPYSLIASKYIEVTITDLQWESWGMVIIGCYLHFDVRLSNGYKHSYEVRDQSGVDLDKAVNGVISRAIETIFQDENIIKFIEE